MSTATVADPDLKWRSRVRATLVLGTWAGSLDRLPQTTRATEGDLHLRLPTSAAHTGTWTAFMWTLADHLSRHGGAVIPAELGRALVGERPPGRAYGPGLPTAEPARLPHSKPWHSTAMASPGLLPQADLASTVPVGLVPDIPLATVGQRARQAAALIQPHSEALDAAAMQAVTVAVVARAAGSALSAEALAGQIADQADSRATHRALRRVPPLVREGSNPQRVAAQLHPCPGPASTVSAALVAFLLHPRDPVSAVRFAIQAAGTVRASAVLAGALCGAHHAERALPVPIQVPQRLTRIADALAGLRAAT